MAGFKIFPLLLPSPFQTRIIILIKEGDEMDLLDQITRALYARSIHYTAKITKKDDIKDLKRIVKEVGESAYQYIFIWNKWPLGLSRSYGVLVGKCPFDYLPRSIKEEFSRKARFFLSILESGNELFDFEIVDRYLDYESNRYYCYFEQRYFKTNHIVSHTILEDFRLVELIYKQANGPANPDSLFPFVAQYVHNRIRAANGLGAHQLNCRYVPFKIAEPPSNPPSYLVRGDGGWLFDIANAPFYVLPASLQNFFLGVAKDTYRYYSNPLLPFSIDEVGEAFYEASLKHNPDKDRDPRPYSKLSEREKNQHLFFFKYCLQAYEEFYDSSDPALIDQLAEQSYMKATGGDNDVYAPIEDINYLSRLRVKDLSSPYVRFNKEKDRYEIDLSMAEFADLPADRQREWKRSVKDVVELLQDGVVRTEDEIGEILLQKERHRHYFLYTSASYPSSFAAGKKRLSSVDDRIIYNYRRIKEAYEKQSRVGR